jgi:hypothetical protein
MLPVVRRCQVLGIRVKLPVVSNTWLLTIILHMTPHPCHLTLAPDTSHLVKY